MESAPLRAARELGPELRRRAPEIEAERRLPADLAKRFAAEGFFRTCVPAVYGGLEWPPEETARLIEVLAEADGSCAWCVFIGATSGSALARLPESAAREVFANPETLVAGVFAPRGRADRVEQGFRATGQWAWGSGTQNADWILGGCRLFEGDEPLLQAGGAPRTHMLLVPASEVEFLDTWHSSGLCGTGSTDFVIRDAFVPEERVVGLAADAGVEGPLYAFPQFGLLGLGIAAVCLGLARAAIDDFVVLATEKQPAGSSRTLAERAAVQAELSRAEAERRSARAFFYETLAAAYAAACEDGRISVAMRRDVRLATTLAVGASARAVDRMYHLAGGTSVYRSSPLQRIFRDVHVATQHMMVSPATLELTGRLLLGLETNTAQL